jgi:uncharacterized protein DUF4189
MRPVTPAQQSPPMRRELVARARGLRHCWRLGQNGRGDTRDSVLAGLLVVCLVCTGTGEAAADNYGAIAYSLSTKAYGWSYDYPSRSSAEREALAKCRTKASDCMIPVWFRNACAALAIGPNGYGTAWATERGNAERLALQVCSRHSGGCAVTRWVCTTR